MDDMTGKIQEILSDKESMKQLNELAQMFSSQSNNNNNTSDNNTAQSDNFNMNFDMNGIDISKFIKIQEIMNKSDDDNTTRLLLALKPMLKKEKHERVDKAVKILKMLTIFTVLKESGLLNDMF